MWYNGGGCVRVGMWGDSRTWREERRGLARPLRIDQAGGFYHVTTRGGARQEIFFDDGDRKQMLELLGAAHERCRVVFHGYCLMSNHYHLEVETPEPPTAEPAEPEAPPTPEPEVVELEFWHEWDETNNPEAYAWSQQVIEAFEAEYPGITVDAVAIPDQQLSGQLLVSPGADGCG